MRSAAPGPDRPGPAPGGEGTSPPGAGPAWRRFLPLLLLLAASLAAFFYLRGQGVDFDTIARHRAWLMIQVEENGLLTGLLLFAAYVAIAALSLPIGSLLTVLAGYLFGTLVGSLWVIAGATLGSIVIFLVARGALHETLAARAGPWLKRMERGFRENALSYLLVLRLLPIFPFWLVNLVPALLGVPLRIYILGTAAGIVPGTIVFASVGSGLGRVLDRGEQPDLSLLMDPAIFLPLLGLALLALLPVVYKIWRKRRGA